VAHLAKKLQHELTLKYVIALFLIALLSTLTFYVLNSVLKKSNNTGLLVNISGKQRMLSQHIALDMHRIHNLHMHHEEGMQYPKTITTQVLISHTEEMFEANKKLSTGLLSTSNKYTLSSAIKEMYFKEMNLAQRVQEYVNIAKKFAHTKNHEEMDKLIKLIDNKSEPLLKDLHKMVVQYQLEGEEALKNMKQLETIAWATTIFVLLLEVIFIFQPMVRKILDLETKHKNVLQHLEDTVEIRTMHLESANNKLAQLAFHDPLTGLKNRLNLERDIENAIRRNKEHKAPFAALMFDIDWFKKVNDEHGHDVGDKVLVEVSNILLTSVREEDKVYRAGGEEFVILLNRINLEESMKIAEKIRSVVETHVCKVNDLEFSKTISCGLYHSSLLVVSDVQSVLKLIDIALYASKANGRNKITKVSKNMAINPKPK